MRKLRSNREVALTHLEEVITKYAVQQDDTEEQERRKRLDKNGKDKEVKPGNHHIFGLLARNLTEPTGIL